ncbi:DegT/DnrJ/EryC1/StrS family aminotransferase [Novosphingobium panipatense]|uniref:DegT/DnrJ/EryC1/StrS family aminotransferase n=1 Tax=Novosphingobium TaxID=165696 RepID=UPI000CDA2411|nr:DegT/DnrJ/EryC1/StrS family aminotransferase [Novosphingobium sp. HII-3]
MNALSIEKIESTIALVEPAARQVRSRWPCHEADEIEAVCEVLQSGRVNALVHGTHNIAFAAEFADYIGMPHGLCIANGTLTLEVALRALGIGPGDEVIVPARSFFASASCVLAVGALPVFADVAADSQNIDPVSVERMIGPRTRAVLCVHLAGWPCDMDAMVALCRDHGLLLLEDCAQAHGATWKGRRVGSFGAASSFSFCTDKIMSTGGEGGVLLLRDQMTWEVAWSIKDHGKSHAMIAPQSPPSGAFRYIHDLAGSNYRMTEMQAAIGRRQLTKLPGWLDMRRRNARILLDAWKDLDGLLLPRLSPDEGHAWYKFYVQLAAEGREPAAERERILQRLLARGIPAGTGSCPDMSQEKAFTHLPVRRDGDLPRARALGRRTLMFPVDHTMETSDMNYIAEAVREAFAE